jgi:hypothetical protein
VSLMKTSERRPASPSPAPARRGRIEPEMDEPEAPSQLLCAREDRLDLSLRQVGDRVGAVRHGRTGHPGHCNGANGNDEADASQESKLPAVPDRVPRPLAHPAPRLPGRFVVDHTLYDTTSILATIESRYGLAPLGGRDRGVRDLAGVFSARPPGLAREALTDADARVLPPAPDRAGQPHVRPRNRAAALAAAHLVPQDQAGMATQRPPERMDVRVVAVHLAGAPAGAMPEGDPAIPG